MPKKSRKDSDSDSEAKTPKGKRYRAAPVEKRRRRWVNAMPAAVSQRLERALNQRIFLIRRETPSAHQHTFHILGSVGNVYEVHISHEPHCTCPDYHRASVCKHMLFVYLRVLRMDRESPLIYQKALLTSELEQMFAGASVDPTVLANERVRSKFEELQGGTASTSLEHDEIKQRPVEGDCPICYEELKPNAEALVWCKTSCGNTLHAECFQQWKQQALRAHQPLTCVYCRAPWEKEGSKNSQDREGYVNLASLQGISRQRDTSSYASRWEHYRGYYHDDEEA